MPDEMPPPGPASEPAPDATTAPAATPTTLLSAPPPAPAEPAKDSETTPPADPKAEEAKEPEGAPAEYADFTMPEGMAVNAELTAELKAWATEHNLPQAKAQALADMGAKAVQTAMEQQALAWGAIQEGWVKSLATDKEFGGAAFDANLGVAQAAFNDTRLVTPELRALLSPFDAKTNPTGLGLGLNPEVTRLFYRVGKLIGDDTMHTGKAGGVDPAKTLYPNSNMN